MVLDNVFHETPFSDIGKGGPAKRPADKQNVLFLADPGGKVFGSVESEFGKTHAIEFEPGELPQILEVGDGIAGVFMDVKDFRREIDEAGKEVAELFDGIDAYAAAIIGHKQVLNGLETFRNDEDRAFGIVKSFPQVRIGLAAVGFGIEMFPTDEDQIGETAFPDEKVLIPWAVVGMEGIG